MWKPLLTVAAIIAAAAAVKAGITWQQKFSSVDDAIATSRALAAAGDTRGAQQVLIDEANKIIKGRIEYQPRYPSNVIPFPSAPAGPAITSPERRRQLAAMTARS